jgi:chaperonin cofactor prefoldin
MAYRKVIEWVFYSLLSFVAWRMMTTLDNLTTSVNFLNTQIAVVIERQSAYENRFEQLENRLDRVETKGK